MDDINGYEIVDNDTVLIHRTLEQDTLYFILDVKTGELQQLDTAW